MFGKLKDAESVKASRYLVPRARFARFTRVKLAQRRELVVYVSNCVVCVYVHAEGGGGVGDISLSYFT